MDQAHARSLAALQQFILLATTTKNASPRFLADLIKRATETPGTFVFTELLQIPTIQALRASDVPAEFQAYLTLLEIFSWGTYQEYKSKAKRTVGLPQTDGCTGTPNLPDLNEPQTQKLKQLSLLTLASPFVDARDGANALDYDTLLRSLSLPDPAALESLVTSCIYAGLMTARLSPTSSPPAVHIHTVAPLRDLRPQSLPAILQILSTWSGRCDSVVSDVESHIENIKNEARRRHTLAEKRQNVVDTAVGSTEAADKKGGRSERTRGNKRDLDDENGESDGESMEVDEGFADMAGGGMSLAGGARGTKRGRGQG